MHKDEAISEGHVQSFSRQRAYFSTLIGLVCFAWYLIVLARMPLPGDSVNNLLLLLRLAPVESFRNPIWFSLGRTVLHVIPGQPLLLIHGMNAFLGAACAALIFWVMSGVQHNRTSEERIRNVRPFWPQLISGLAAAAILALCAPFWFASVRAFPQTLHVFLILLMIVLLLTYKEQGEFRWLVLFSLLYGVSLVESALLLLFSPLFFAACLVVLWHHNQLRFRFCVTLLLAFLAGLSVIFLHAWVFMQSPTFAWREFSGYGHLLSLILKDHYLLAMRGVPRVGWLMIGLFSIVPWLLIVPFPRTGEKKKGSWGGFLLVFILTLLGVVVLANHTITPWAQFGLIPLVVLPYLFLASWMGYLAGYWYIIASRPRRPGARARSDRRYLLRRLYVGFLVVGILALGVRNYHEVSDRQALPSMGLARDVVASLEGREWLVTNGAIDGLILYAAFEAGVPLNVLNMGLAQAPLHRKHVASLMTDPRLRSLAMVGMGPLLEEWISGRESVTDELAVFTNADLWQSRGYVAVPHGVVFLGARQNEDYSAAVLRERADPILRRKAGRLDDAVDALRPLPSLNRWVFRHYSKIANNLGVFTEDAGDAESALDLYQMALRINPGNVSALLNAFTLTEGQDTEDAQDIADRIALLERDLDARLQIWGLAYHHGYVRHPVAFFQMGWAWAMTGKAGAAIRDFERAASLAGNGSQLQMALAALYYREGRHEESEQAYFSMLVNDPDNATAILGLARLAMRQGQYDQARGYLTRLLELGVPKDIVRIELATLEIMIGNLPQAVEILEQVFEESPTRHQAPVILALIAMDAGDEDALARYVDRLERTRDPPPSVRFILAMASLRIGSTERARHLLEQLLGDQPGHVQALETLIRLDLGSGRLPEAEARIRQLFRVDPSNAFANLALGSVQYVRGELDLAETSFLTSIEQQPTSDALNSLAWVYMSLGRFREAQEYAARAVRADPRNAFALDTLGESSIYLGNLELAASALSRALELIPNSPQILYHFALLQEAKGDISHSLKIVNDLLMYGDQIAIDLRRDLLALKDRIQ